MTWVSFIAIMWALAIVFITILVRNATLEDDNTDEIDLKDQSD